MINEVDKIKNYELFLKLIEGTIEPEDQKKLNSLIANSPEVARQYNEFIIDYVRMQKKSSVQKSSLNVLESVIQKSLWTALAEDERTAPAINIPKEEQCQDLIENVVYPKTSHKLTRFNLFTVVVSAAAILFVILFVKFNPPKPYSVEVATLVDQVNAQWADSAVYFENGYRLWTKDAPMHLDSGLINIRYDNGVDVFIEGPAKFEIERLGLFLEYGRVYSTVPKTGSGFSVETPTCRFVDLGTEFGIRADINGSSELHVFKGAVQLFAGSAKNAKISQTVRGNKAVQFNAGNGKVQSIPIQKRNFAYRMPSPHETAIQQLKPFAYWRFDFDDDRNCFDSMGVIRPVVKTSALRSTQGPRLKNLEDNTALEFSDYQAKVSVPGISREPFLKSGYTIAAWVRIDQLPAEDEILSIISTIRMDTNQLSRLLSVDSQGFFTHKPVDNILRGATKAEIGQWYHVVIACDVNANRYLFVNGKEDSRPVRYIEFSDTIIDPLDRLYFGSTVEKLNPRLGFKGALDEIVIFSKVLNSEEIRSLYQSAVIAQ